MYGYKVIDYPPCTLDGFDGSTHKRFLLTFGIPEKSQVEVCSYKVVKKETAEYRTDYADLLKIEPAEYDILDGVPYDFGCSPPEIPVEKIPTLIPIEKLCTSVRDKSKYRVGSRIVAKYNTGEYTFEEGIHFFRDPHVAALHGLRALQDGLYQNWSLGGILRKECLYMHCLREGMWRTFYADGTPKEECEMLHDRLHGRSRCWYTLGKSCHGFRSIKRCSEPVETWYVNGEKVSEPPKHNGRYIKG